MTTREEIAKLKSVAIGLRLLAARDVAEAVVLNRIKATLAEVIDDLAGDDGCMETSPACPETEVPIDADRP